MITFPVKISYVVRAVIACLFAAVAYSAFSFGDNLIGIGFAAGAILVVFL